jgi:hypothetical protein
MKRVIPGSAAILLGLLSTSAPAQLGGVGGSGPADDAIGSGIGSTASGTDPFGVSNSVHPRAGSARSGIGGNMNANATTPGANMISSTVDAAPTTRSASSDVKSAVRKSRRDAEQASSGASAGN